MTPASPVAVEPGPEGRSQRLSPPLSRACPACGVEISAAEPVCRGCSAQLDRESAKELRRSWHRLRSMPEAGWRMQVFGDYAREELRRCIAVRGAQKW